MVVQSNWIDSEITIIGPSYVDNEQKGISHKACSYSKQSKKNPHDNELSNIDN